jgi:hypothetical protein
MMSVYWRVAIRAHFPSVQQRGYARIKYWTRTTRYRTSWGPVWYRKGGPTFFSSILWWTWESRHGPVFALLDSLDAWHSVKRMLADVWLISLINILHSLCFVFTFIYTSFISFNLLKQIGKALLLPQDLVMVQRSQPPGDKRGVSPNCEFSWCFFVDSLAKKKR